MRFLRSKVLRSPRLGPKCIARAWPFCLSLSAAAAQLGPAFPTHRFPTSESMHLTYSLGIIKTSSNFVETNRTDTLTNDASLRVFQHHLTAEIQPSRKLSVGAILSFDQVKLGDRGSELSVKESGLGDQRIFGEYRFYDQVGSSAGLALVVKFPAYKNPTVATDSVALLGDAQTDFTAMGTGEHWFSPHFRTRSNLGLTFRTEGYAGEIPFMISAGFVSPKIDLDLRIRGNFSLNNDALADAESTPEGVDQMRQAFANSRYALASNPWVLVINPVLEVWTSTRTALSFEYQYSLMGNNVPHFHYFAFGWTTRWASNKRTRAKTFQQVDMSTQQDPEQFQGELYERDAEPKPEDDDAILEEPN